MNKKAGTLYGIGVGPGDPDLITIKAAKILSRVKTVFAAASTKNHHSLAVNIAERHIPRDTAVKMLRFPMTRDKDETHKAWRANARIIIEELEKEQINREVPDFAPGDLLVVQVKVKEGNRERLQAFEGVVIARRSRGNGLGFRPSCSRACSTWLAYRWASPSVCTKSPTSRPVTCATMCVSSA